MSIILRSIIQHLVEGLRHFIVLVSTVIYDDHDDIRTRGR
jgi:hypothetical protein